MSSPAVFALSCAVKEYAWGKPGHSSAVSQLVSAADDTFKVNNNATYAELWMGTHPSGPSRNKATSQSLSDYLTLNPHSVGGSVRRRFPKEGQLPFLFKVLSVNKSLSIQAHPNKRHAEQLHRDHNYPDDNHKPEMAVALTTFEGLCGFRPRHEIVNFLRVVPEFRAVVGSPLADSLEQAANEEAAQSSLRDCFASLMSADISLVEEQLRNLVKRISEMKLSHQDLNPVLGNLLLRIYEQFPGDVGCFCIYFLNHMTLQPGEAMFLEANLPHAYLLGDCIECMACSDNVVRAGLTPKLKDIHTLVSMLNYSSKSSQENLFPSQQDPTDAYLTVYNPPVDDFTVARMKIPAGCASYTLPTVDSASLLLVLSGRATVTSTSLGNATLFIARGSVLFIGAGERVDLSDLSPSEETLMFRAYCLL